MNIVNSLKGMSGREGGGTGMSSNGLVVNSLECLLSYSMLAGAQTRDDVEDKGVKFSVCYLHEFYRHSHVKILNIPLFLSSPP